MLNFFAGFMMEMASWDGGVSRTVQFLVPKVRSVIQASKRVPVDTLLFSECLPSGNASCFF